MRLFKSYILILTNLNRKFYNQDLFLSEDLSSQWEGDACEKAWKLLKCLLEETPNKVYFNATVDRVFEIDPEMLLPAWLMNYYLVRFLSYIF